MSLAYSFTRAPGGPRYSGTERQAGRVKAATGAAATLTADALDAMLSDEGIEVVADVLFEVESNRLGRAVTNSLTLDTVATSPYSGDVATLSDGKRAATPANPPVVFTTAVGLRAIRQRWTDARLVNVVELIEDTATCRITSVRVKPLDAAGNPTLGETNVVSTTGRISAKIAPYDNPVSCYGVQVELRGGTLLGGATRYGIVEVDAMLIRDVSESVQSVTVEFAREDDATQAASPFGTFAASTCDVTLDDTDGQWNPGTNASLDVGHRIEVAFGVVRDDGVEELLPAGVFYSDPFGTDSDATVVSIHGTDRLVRSASSTITEPVAVNAAAGPLLKALAAKYLDLDAEQVVVDPTIAAVVIPYAYPSGNLGSYFADLAAALGSTMHMDPYDRLVFGPRNAATGDPVIEITDENALQRFRRSPGYDVTTSVVEVTASPLNLDVDSELWTMPSGGISVPASGTYSLVAPYAAPPAINGYVTGIVADGSYTVTAAAYYADRAELKIQNNETRTLVIADLKVRGTPLVETPLTGRAEHAPSVRRYGPRTLAASARLVQTQAAVEALAAMLLDTFRSLDDNGKRRIPDLTFDALGILHLAAGDRVTLAHSTKGLGGDYVLLSRRLTYEGGALLTNDARVREAATYDVLTLDSGEKLDDGHVVGF